MRSVKVGNDCVVESGVRESEVKILLRFEIECIAGDSIVCGREREAVHVETLMISYVEKMMD